MDKMSPPVQNKPKQCQSSPTNNNDDDDNDDNVVQELLEQQGASSSFGLDVSIVQNT